MRLAGPVLALALIALAQACGGGKGELLLGATTSLQDTGILDALISGFEEQSGYTVTPVVAGSGQVLELARRGEIDVSLTHAPAEEEQLVTDGDGVNRLAVMQNLFVVAGPPDDGARVSGSASPAEAFRRIAAAGHTFISRGDDSGTHVRELAIWAEAGIQPQGLPWYQESAIGQGQNLAVASEKAAYTLVDRATFRVLQKNLQLVAYVTDAARPNIYSVMRVNPEKHPGVNAEAARAFAAFVTSGAGRKIISEFGVKEYGDSLFTPVSAAGGSPQPAPTARRTAWT
ncbi:MAG: substrate-binding domain-containing protein [Dehalococcoidia bacterium]|nr:substrate-binding domain-containing protein [Dehalococcoidia bacterium]